MLLRLEQLLLEFIQRPTRDDQLTGLLVKVTGRTRNDCLIASDSTGSIRIRDPAGKMCIGQHVHIRRFSVEIGEGCSEIDDSLFTLIVKEFASVRQEIIPPPVYSFLTDRTSVQRALESKANEYQMPARKVAILLGQVARFLFTN